MNSVVLYIVVLCFEGWLRVAEPALCSKTIKKGPYKFEKTTKKMEVPAKHIVSLQRVMIVKDVELSVMHRSYWSSYCYNGGSIDPNTGCYAGITQLLPSREESAEWIRMGKCLIGDDCTDCWASDSVACADPGRAPKHWTPGKELTRLQNNNHFFCHTCNLSWRCGIHKTAFPTFLTGRDGKWTAYTETSNGTEIVMNYRDFWQFDDVVIRKTAEYETKTDRVNVSCFFREHEKISCYDQVIGNFFELNQSDWVCDLKVCYRLDDSSKEVLISKSRIDNDMVANLKAASIADVKRVIATEHLLNEEMRFNFGKLTEEVIELRRILTQVILSTAKIDDKLIGNVMGYTARSQFLSDDAFLLSPCSDPKEVQSNCYKDLIFKNGRWLKRNDSKECLSLVKVESIDLFHGQELWFPEINDQPLIGTSEDLEGWSYYAHERENLDRAMQWTRNGQQTTSLEDIYLYPRGMMNSMIAAFIVSHIGTILGVLVIAFILWIKVIRTNGSRSESNVNFRVCDESQLAAATWKDKIEDAKAENVILLGPKGSKEKELSK